MPRKGENIYKRKDGRWEGRYIRSYDSEHKAKYAYVYGKTYSEVKRKLTEQRGNVQKVQPTKNKSSTYGELLDCWLHSMQLNTKESTQARYTHLIKTHIKPHLGAVQLSQLTTDASGQLDAAAQSIISEHINDHQSDYDKVRSLHDYLKSNLEYDTVAASSHRPNERNIAEAHNIIGALLKRKCVCEGFAKAFKFLCDKIDLECWVVSGKGSSSIGVGPHAWNIVKINGYYHHVDVTWDNQYSDSSSMPNYGYMNLSDDEIAKDHTWNKKHYPECPSSPYNYFRVNNALLDSNVCCSD